MSRRAHDDEKHDVKPFDCVSSGQVYRDFKNAALRFLAGVLDESGSSLADQSSTQVCLPSWDLKRQWSSQICKCRRMREGNMTM